jgi:putative ABC transport system permease protein
MSWWRQFTHGLRALTNRGATDRDVADEVEYYVEQAAAAWVERGLSPRDARRAAERELGNATVVREQVRSYGWENAVESLAVDVQYGARRLIRSPGFSTLAALTIAIGVGASTTIFSAVNPILFQPLPYPQPDRVMMIWDHGPDGAPLEVTFGTFRELQARSRSFEALAVMKPWQPTLNGASHPERLDGQRVSEHYFRALGIEPVLGRAFRSDDDRPGAPRVVIISDGFWRRRFGADATVVGRDVSLNEDRYTVIGVMPPTFENVLAPAAEVWGPLQYDTALPPMGREWGHHLWLVGRLTANQTIEHVKSELDDISRHHVREFARVPWAMLEDGLIVSGLQDDVTRDVKPALLAVFGAVLLVLVIACVNVTNLLLARGIARRGEFAMRTALGAARTRLIRLLLTESLLLSLVGGAFGILIATGGTRMVIALSPPELPRAGAIAVDGTVFVFALGITTVVGVLVGLIPAVHLSRRDLHTALQQSARPSVASQHHLTRRTLVVAEVALAIVLLVTAGLLSRSMQRLLAIAPGFDSRQLLTLQVQPSSQRYMDAERSQRFLQDALDAVRRVPGVRAAAFTSQLPLSGDSDRYGVQLESSGPAAQEEERDAFRYAVSAGYFEAMGIPLRAGRLLDERDTAEAPPAVVISESLARRRFAGRDPIGQRVHVGPSDRPWYTIVGVVGDVKQASLAAVQADAAYVPSVQWFFADQALWFVVRTRGAASPFVQPVCDAIWSVDANQAIVRVATMEGRLAASAADRRFTLTVFETFGSVAILLAAIGIYGVLSGSVSERTREIGVRTALGASRANILALVARQGLTLTGLGLAIGLTASLAATGAIATLLFGVSRVDPATYAGAIALLLAASAIAWSVPAWRAARVDPAIAFRVE